MMDLMKIDSLLKPCWAAFPTLGRRDGEESCVCVCGQGSIDVIAARKSAIVPPRDLQQIGHLTVGLYKEVKK
jgi:hypothetical protein